MNVVPGWALSYAVNGGFWNTQVTKWADWAVGGTVFRFGNIVFSIYKVAVCAIKVVAFFSCAGMFVAVIFISERLSGKR